MKKSLTALALLAMAAATPVLAQTPTSTATNTAGATIIKPIAMTSTQPMNFTRVIANTTAATVQMPATSGTVTLVDPSGVVIPGGAPTAARFAVTGEPGMSFTVVVPDNVTLQSGADQMSIDALTSSIASGTLDASGDSSFHVGGRLNIGANQASGSYTGSAGVQVAYN